jgi:hypothetical protein
MWFLKTAATMKPRKLPHLKNWCGSYQSKRIHILTFAGDKSSEGERIEQPGFLLGFASLMPRYIVNL